jgi:5-methylcytosine-specific restriction endonuclease McrA
MKKHKQVYFDYYDIDPGDFVACENCGRQGVDIHHLKFRSQGGQDVIENLMCLCRECHFEVHNGTKIKTADLIEKHLKNLKQTK